jgi:hypothetical protein
VCWEKVWGGGIVCMCVSLLVEEAAGRSGDRGIYRKNGCVCVSLLAVASTILCICLVLGRVFVCVDVCVGERESLPFSPHTRRMKERGECFEIYESKQESKKCEQGHSASAGLLSNWFLFSSLSGGQDHHLFHRFFPSFRSI